MKNLMKKIGNILMQNRYVVAMILSLLAPDIVLRAQCKAYAIPSVALVPVLFTVFWIALFVMVMVCFMKKRWGRIIYLILSIFMTVFMVSNYVYYRIFGQFYWLDNLGMTGQAMNYASFFMRLVDWRIIAGLGMQIALIVLTCLWWKEKTYRISGLWLFLPVIVLLTVHTVMMTKAVPGKTALQQSEREWAKRYYSSFSDSNRSMQTAGAYQYVMRNIFRIVFPEAEFDKQTITIADQYFEEKKIWSDNDKTGMLAGKNVIMVMMESIDDWMVNEKYMPTVSYMRKNGIDFTNHFACTFGTGYTFNTEYSVNTGYHATMVGSPVSSLTENTYPYSLPRSFKEKGYSARMFHFNSPDFYNRGQMHKVFGYSDYVSFSDYMPMEDAQCDSLAIKNKKIYSEFVPKSETPFFHFMVTYSAHLPYNDEDTKVQKLTEMYPEYVDNSMDEELNNAMLMAHDTDEFFRILLTNLEKDGLLENTVIIGFADHFSYGLSDWQKMYPFGDISSAQMLEKVPFFVYAKGMEGESVEKVTNTMDILPTLVNLFGLNKTKYWLGEDAFDPAYGGHAYFSNGSWYDGKIYYVAENHISDYPMPVSGYVEQMNEKFYIREKVNEAIVRTDYFREE